MPAGCSPAVSPQIVPSMYLTHPKSRVGASEAKRLHHVLGDGDIKLGGVVSDINCLSARGRRKLKLANR